MATRLKGFDRELTLFLQDLEPATIARELAAFAKRSVADAISNGEASPVYRRIVDGVEGAPEERVRADGKIVYEFAYWGDVIAALLDEAVQRSPERSGRYKFSWFVMVNGQKWTRDFDAIPVGSEVIITNDQPYHRKIEVGAMRLSVPPGIVEDLYQLALRRFGNMIKPDVKFITLQGGYILKGRQISRAAKYAKRIAAGGPGVRGTGHATRRKDSRAGQEMTYPALVLIPR